MEYIKNVFCRGIKTLINLFRKILYREDKVIKYFQCPGCGSKITLSESGISGTTAQCEEIGGAGTSGSMDVKNWPEAQTLKNKWGTLGLNNHEEASLRLGYDKVISEYMKLKLKILESRDISTLPSKKYFYEGLRIYIYTIYENLFFGYMISYASNQNSAFIFQDKCKKFRLDQQYYNHLPSFSSALLHFGNCRDLIFVLVNLANKQAINNVDEYNDIMNVRHANGDKFCADLEKLCNTDSAYIAAGKRIFQLHRFRNIYEHQFRLLWWTNKMTADNVFCIKKDLYNAIINNDKSQIKNMLFEILQDPQKYENEILESDPAQIICSNDVLKNIHDQMACFFNDTLLHISNKI